MKVHDPRIVAVKGLNNRFNQFSSVSNKRKEKYYYA